MSTTLVAFFVCIERVPLFRFFNNAVHVEITPPQLHPTVSVRYLFCTLFTTEATEMKLVICEGLLYETFHNLRDMVCLHM